LTRVLNLLGAALPRPLLPAAADNPGGFWEGCRFVQSNDRALARAGLRWFDPGPVPSFYFTSETAEAIADDLAKLVHANFADAALYAVKDPRLCRLIPLWRRVLDRVGSPISPILVIRDPQDVALSMLVRDRLPLPGGHLLWLRHVLEAEAATRDLLRTIVSYDDLIDDWRSVVARLTDEHEIKWINRNPTTEATIDKFLNPALRHHRRSSDDGLPQIGAEWSEPVYRALTKLEGYAVLDRVHQDIDHTHQLYRSSARVIADWSKPRFPQLVAGLEAAKRGISRLRARANRFGVRARRASRLR
jgi:hypothetical protein